eukprot:RCo027271
MTFPSCWMETRNVGWVERAATTSSGVPIVTVALLTLHHSFLSFCTHSLPHTQPAVRDGCFVLSEFPPFLTIIRSIYLPSPVPTLLQMQAVLVCLRRIVCSMEEYEALGMRAHLPRNAIMEQSPSPGKGPVSSC